LAITAVVLIRTPTGFIPDQDQGNLLAAVQLPAGATLARTDKAALAVADAALRTPGVIAASTYAGVDATSGVTQSNSGQLYLILQDFSERLPKGLAANADADVKIIPPAPVRGIGTAGGLRMIIEDRTGHSYEELAAAANAVAA